MGGGNHKCCDVTVNHSAPTAAIAQNSIPQVLVPGALSGVVLPEIALPQHFEKIRSSLIQTTSSPPDSLTILRV